MHVAQLLATKVNQSNGRGRLEEDVWDGSRAYTCSHIWHHKSNSYLVILKKGNHRLQNVETYGHINKQNGHYVFTRVGLRGPTPHSRS